MLFDSLDKLKRNSIMSSILLIFLGAFILICPLSFIPSLTLLFGYTLIVIALVMILNFLSGKKALMNYLKFIGAMFLLMMGVIVLVFIGDIARVLAWLFGLLLVVDGSRTMFHSFTYARRSRRKGWWVLTILSALLIAAGLILYFNPWWNTTDALTKVIGCALMFSSLVSAIRLIWTWPLRDAKGGYDNDKKRV